MSSEKRQPPTRVLVIDSDNVRRGMLACTLPAHRYSLEFASTPEKGLDLLPAMDPEVVILEAGDLCQRIRSLPAGQACTLVVIDERFTDEASGQREAEAAGADTFLPFPFELDLLEARLGQTRRPAGAAGRPAPRGGKAAEPAAREPAAPSTAPEDTWARFEEQVEALHGRLDAADYYELLEVPREATAAQIKQAYFDRAIEYHPDRFLQLSDRQLRERIYQIFKRISEAFKVLVNPDTRCAYDDILTGPDPQIRRLERHSAGATRSPLGEARTPAGRRYLNHALLAESSGNLRSARMYLSMALQYEPDNEALQERLDALVQRLV